MEITMLSSFYCCLFTLVLNCLLANVALNVSISIDFSHGLAYIIILLICPQKTLNCLNSVIICSIFNDFSPWLAKIIALLTACPQETLDCLCELYSLLMEEDMFVGTWLKKAKQPETNTALAYMQHGFFEQAQTTFEGVSLLEVFVVVGGGFFFFVHAHF